MWSPVKIFEDTCSAANNGTGLSIRARQQIVDRGIGALYRWYISRSQSRRNWNPDTGFKWREVSQEHSPELLTIVQGFYAVEQFVPDYTAQLVSLVRRDYGRSQYYIRWGSEEAKHADLWRNVLLATGYRDLSWIENYTHELRQQAWELPFDDPLEMLLYTVLQERATYLNYANMRTVLEGKSEKPWHQADADPVLAGAAKTIATDEIAHYEFYLTAAQIYLYYFPERTLKALARVLAIFEMPAARIVPDYAQFIESLYRSGMFGRRAYVVDVVRVISDQLGIRDFAELDAQVKLARRAPDDKGALQTAEAILIADHSIVQHSVLQLFIRVCQFEQEQGISGLFNTGFQPFDWETSDDS